MGRNVGETLHPWASATVRWAALTAWWAAVLPPVTPTITSHVFFKVTTPQFPDLSTCTLETWPLSDKLTCAAVCQRTSQCSMYCLSGGSCHLYSVRVARNWDAEGSPMTGICYSNWGNDLMSTGTIVASIDHSSTYKASNAISGFFCNSLNQCYCTQGDTKGYLAISFGSQRRVTSVQIQTWSNFFKNVEVRVGNFSSHEDQFSNNALLGSYTGEVTAKGVVTLKAPTTLVGSVVSIYQSTESMDHLCLCDVQVFVG